MSFTIKTTTKLDDAANFITLSILNKLKLNKHVLFFITGGSSIPICVKIAELLKSHSYKNLTVTLTDERYGLVNHQDSNWYKLIKEGFNLPEAKLIPVLNGEDHTITTEKFNIALAQEFKNADYKIGLFGVGADGHTAGILPDSIAVNSKELVCGYDTPIFSRVTITPKAIEQLDEAVAWIQGEEKWEVLKDLASSVDELRPREKDIPARPHEGLSSQPYESWQGAGGNITKQPAQILKKVPLLTIFTDYPVRSLGHGIS